jgi:aryl-alcohol dehydrogenase (NADP+)
LDYASEHGITYLDTAEYYSDGMSERIIGNWMHQKGCRDKMTVLTKFYLDTAPRWGSREYIHKALDASLDRLRTIYVDIYMIHLPDLKVSIEETLSALTAEFDAGRVRAIACSNFDADQLTEALQASSSGEYQRFIIVQAEYSLAIPQYIKPGDPGHFHAVRLCEAEDRLFPFCQSENIATTIYSPLAGGFLSGQYARGTSPPESSRASWNGRYISRRLTERNFQILDKLQAMARVLDMPIYTLAMAWAISNPAVTSIITGARKLEHIDNAVEASKIRLDLDVRAEMTSWIR